MRSIELDRFAKEPETKERIKTKQKRESEKKKKGLE